MLLLLSTANNNNQSIVNNNYTASSSSVSAVTTAITNNNVTSNGCQSTCEAVPYEVGFKNKIVAADNFKVPKCQSKLLEMSEDAMLSEITVSNNNLSSCSMSSTLTELTTVQATPSHYSLPAYGLYNNSMYPIPFALFYFSIRSLLLFVAIYIAAFTNWFLTYYIIFEQLQWIIHEFRIKYHV